MSKVSKGSTGERVDSAEERAGRGVRRAGGAQGRWEGRGVGEVMARALSVWHGIALKGTKLVWAKNRDLHGQGR